MSTSTSSILLTGLSSDSNFVAFKFDISLGNQQINIDEMCNYLGYFAALETIARSGLPPMDIKKSLVEDTNMEIIKDLKNLGVLFEERFITSGLLELYQDEIRKKTLTFN